MKKRHLILVTVIMLTASLTLSSCIGSFTMFNRVKAWNEQVGDKFVNELVFIAMWILPVYELSFAADLLVLNSIEFWSGTNPLMGQTQQVIDGKDARYLVERDATGYAITNLSNHKVTRLNFDATSNTWSMQNGQGEQVPFLTFIDDTHVGLPAGNGTFTTVELSQAGVFAYSHLAPTATMMAHR